MKFDLVRVRDNHVVGTEYAANWKDARYKLALDAHNYVKQHYPDKAFAGLRKADNGEIARFVIRAENGQEMPVNIKIQNKVAPRRPVIKHDGPITPKQKAFLRRHGHDIPSNATKKWASAVISDILGS